MIAEEREIHSTGLLLASYFTRFGPISTMTFVQVTRTETPPPPPLLRVPGSMFSSSPSPIRFWDAEQGFCHPTRFGSTFQGFPQARSGSSSSAATSGGVGDSQSSPNPAWGRSKQWRMAGAVNPRWGKNKKPEQVLPPKVWEMGQNPRGCGKEPAKSTKEIIQSSGNRMWCFPQGHKAGIRNYKSGITNH
ncbi:hypothetical protein Nmel_013759, partial [Mimus melanotis]